MSEITDEKLIKLSNELGHLLQRKKIRIATAESCTGGWLAQVITAIPGSSEWFDRGFVTYSNLSKQELLKVKANTLKDYGAVSQETAIEMALGALQNSQAEFTIAITGIAGPTGGTLQKPVGTVYFAWAIQGQPYHHAQQCFSGNRESIRYQAVEFALKQALDLL